MNTRSDTQQTGDRARADGAGSRGRAAMVASVVILSIAGMWLYWLSHPRPTDTDPILGSARSQVAFVLGDRWAEGHGFGYPLRSYERLRPDVARALTPRDAASIGDTVVPKDFAGTMIMNGLALRIWRSLFLGLAPLFSVLAGLALILLAREIVPITDRAAALLLPPLVLATWLAYPPAIVIGSGLTGSDMPAATTMILGFVFFLRFWKTGRRIDLVLMSASLGATVVFRYPNVIVPAILGVSLLVTRRLRTRDLPLAIGLYLPFLGVILLFNWMVYGDPLTTGYHLGAELLRDTANIAEESFFKFRPLVVASHLRLYLIENPVFLAPPLAGAAFGIWRAVRIRRERSAMLALMVATTVFALYYLGQDVVGTFDPVVRASVLRYMLPVLGVWMVLLVHAAIGARWRAAGAVALAALGLAGVWTAVAGPEGVRERFTILDEARAFREAVVTATPRGAVIATRYHDKSLFPDRQTFVLTYLADNPEPVYKGSLGTYSVLPPAERIVDALGDTLARGIPTYILADFPREAFRSYRRALLSGGYRLRRIDGIDPGLFRLRPIPSRGGE